MHVEGSWFGAHVGYALPCALITSGVYAIFLEEVEQRLALSGRPRGADEGGFPGSGRDGDGERDEGTPARRETGGESDTERRVWLRLVGGNARTFPVAQEGQAQPKRHQGNHSGAGCNKPVLGASGESVCQERFPRIRDCRSARRWERGRELIPERLPRHHAGWYSVRRVSLYRAQRSFDAIKVLPALAGR